VGGKRTNNKNGTGNVLAQTSRIDEALKKGALTLAGICGEKKMPKKNALMRHCHLKRFCEILWGGFGQ